MKVLAYVELVCGIIACAAVSWYGIVAGAVCFALFRGFAEVIQLLQDIKDGSNSPVPQKFTPQKSVVQSQNTEADELPEL